MKILPCLLILLMFSGQKVQAQNQEEYFRMTLPTAGIPYNRGKTYPVVPLPLKVSEYLALVDDKNFVWPVEKNKGGPTPLLVFIPLNREYREFLRNSPTLSQAIITIDSRKNYYLNGTKLRSILELERQKAVIRNNKVFMWVGRKKTDETRKKR